jgi:DNA modification methylase
MMIIEQDCVEGMSEMSASSVDCIVTSPPYKDEDGYTDELMTAWLEQAHRILKNNTVLFMNFGHLAGFKSRAFRVAMMAEEAGFTWNDTITWVKNHYRPIQGNKRVNNLTEFIFILTKGKPNLDRLSIGVEYADKSNIGRFADQDLKCRGNVWPLKYKTVQSKEQKRHNDRFPVDLPLWCLRLAAVEGLVVDPFNGSGTTGIASKIMSLEYVGFEINKAHVEYARGWIDG